MSEHRLSMSSAMACLLKERVLVKPDESGTIILHEQTAEMEVEIPNTPSSLIAINLRQADHLSMLKDGEWRRICDYLLITASEGKLFACFVELKKTLTEKLAYREQLRRSLPMLKYLRSVCAIQYGDQRFGPECAVTYNVIASRQGVRIDKQRVRTDPSRWPEVDAYKGMEIRRFVGSRIPVRKLL